MRQHENRATPATPEPVDLAEAALDQVAGGAPMIIPAIRQVPEAEQKLGDDKIPDTFSISLNFEK